MSAPGKMKVKVFRAGNYAGPTVQEPQFKTDSPNEVVEVSPNFAAYLVEHENGELVKDEKPKQGSRNPKPSSADKGRAESE